jgi:hypothetical protein
VGDGYNMSRRTSVLCWELARPMAKRGFIKVSGFTWIVSKNEYKFQMDYKQENKWLFFIQMACPDQIVEPTVSPPSTNDPFKPLRIRDLIFPIQYTCGWGKNTSSIFSPSSNKSNIQQVINNSMVAPASKRMGTFQNTLKFSKSIFFIPTKC